LELILQRLNSRGQTRVALITMGVGFAMCFGREEVPGALKQAGSLDYLRGFVKNTQATGVVAAMDPTDTSLTYKLYFPDGKSDWYREDEVELTGSPFGVVVLPTSGNRLEIKDLKVGDKLSSLCARVARELRQPQSKLVISLGTKVFEQSDMNRCLGVLGFGEGAAVHCAISNFDASLLRVESAADSDYSSGEVETWTVTALIYGRKGSSAQRLLWADHAVNNGSPSVRKSDGLNASISDDRVALHVSKSDGASTALPLTKLFAEATQKSSNLEDQFKNKFGNDENWPRILGRICRKIA